MSHDYKYDYYINDCNINVYNVISEITISMIIIFNSAVSHIMNKFRDKR